MEVRRQIRGEFTRIAQRQWQGNKGVRTMSHVKLEDPEYRRAPFHFKSLLIERSNFGWRQDLAPAVSELAYPV